MKNDIIERYLYAVTKDLPSKMRSDVERELRSLIEDMIEEQYPDAEPNEEQVTEILRALGAPSEMAEKYMNEEDKSLIGAPYINSYKMVLKIVCICVAGGMAVSAMVSGITGSISAGSGEFQVVSGFAGWIANTLTALCSAFTYVTIAFALMQRNKVALHSGKDEFDNLPQIPEKAARISKIETTVNLLLAVAFPVIFLNIPEFLGFASTSGGTELVSLFNRDGVRSLWYVLILISAIGIINGIAALYEGSYTMRYAFISLITNAASFVLSCVFWLNTRVINEEFFLNVTLEFEELRKFSWDASVITKSLLALIALAMCIDTGVAFYKALKYKL